MNDALAEPLSCSGNQCTFPFDDWQDGMNVWLVVAYLGDDVATVQTSAADSELWIEDGCDCGGWSRDVVVTLP